MRFKAPKKVLIAATALALSACSGGSSDGGGGLLDPSNPAGSGSATDVKLELVCPNGVSPGSTVEGFLATLTDGRDRPVEDVFVGLTPSQGTIDAPPDTPSTFGANTSDAGEVPFALRVPNDAAVGTIITIKAVVKTTTLNAMDSCTVPVRANTFVLTRPLSNSTQPVGLLYAQPVQVNWTAANGTGVRGTVNLTATSNGSFTYDTANAGSSPAAADTNAAGQISPTIYFVCGGAGFSTITASASSDPELRDTQTVQCIDPPERGQLTVNPATVAAGSTNPATFPVLSYTVYSASNQPLARQSVTFTLTSPAGGGDRVTPSTGVTDASGTATAQYEPGTIARTVTVQACVAQDTKTCDSRTITVQ
ncbi:MAG: hypothetical protein V4650_06380 [Pseudomonadota bacterium]